MAINFWQQLKKNRFTLGGGTLGAGAGGAGAARAFDPMLQSFAQSAADCLNNPDGCDRGPHLLQISNPEQSLNSIDYTAAASSDGSFLYTKEDILNNLSEAWPVYMCAALVCASMVAVPSIVLAAVGRLIDKKDQDQSQTQVMQIQGAVTPSNIL